MSVPVTLYHNPRCSKSRAALALLEKRGIQPKVVRYLEDPPSPDDIRALLKALDIPPHDLLRAKEVAYREAGLTRDSSEADIISAIIANPILLERPIAVSKKGAAIGRPPERILDIL